LCLIECVIELHQRGLASFFNPPALVGASLCFVNEVSFDGAINCATVQGISTNRLPFSPLAPLPSLLCGGVDAVAAYAHPRSSTSCSIALTPRSDSSFEPVGHTTNASLLFYSPVSISIPPFCVCTSSFGVGGLILSFYVTPPPDHRPWHSPVS